MRKLLLILMGAAVAVSAQAGKPHAPVKIQSQTPQRLHPGQAGDIVVTVTPLGAMDSLQVIFRGEEGLTVQDGQSQTVAAPPAGAPLTHHVMVVGMHEGLFHLTAVATAQIAGHSSSRVMSLEVLVGDPAKAQKAQIAPATQIDSTGQSIRSMPAQERLPQHR